LNSPKSHNPNQLRELAEAIEPRLKEVWPRTTKFERRCYELLRDAYVKARYSRHYRISDEQLGWRPPASSCSRRSCASYAKRASRSLPRPLSPNGEPSADASVPDRSGGVG
jgi:hypothetical protein